MMKSQKRPERAPHIVRSTLDLEVLLEGCRPNAALVYETLLYWTTSPKNAHRDPGECTYTYGSMQRALKAVGMTKGVSNRNLLRVLTELEERGLVELEHPEVRKARGRKRGQALMNTKVAVVEARDNWTYFRSGRAAQLLLQIHCTSGQALGEPACAPVGGELRALGAAIERHAKTCAWLPTLLPPKTRQQDSRLKRGGHNLDDRDPTGLSVGVTEQGTDLPAQMPWEEAGPLVDSDEIDKVNEDRPFRPTPEEHGTSEAPTQHEPPPPQPKWPPPWQSDPMTTESTDGDNSDEGGGSASD